ncbi:zinc finger protein 425-like [Phlebotomus argentipes]|uniref:zinc finger protein 425-like n=1 Tax=Phlebotomus argentipes TaxID=94469 RepID=UPI00289310E9|nr:zinc finger protein 425-like [Phlebotomus argentipes]
MDIKEEKEDPEYCYKSENQFIESIIVKEEYEIQEKTPVYHQKKSDDDIKKKLHKCPICAKEFSCLRQHMNTHSDERNFECAYCSSRFKTKKYLRTHITIHIEKPRPCLICKKMVKDSKRCRIHMWQKHKDSRKEFFCGICAIMFTNQFHYDQHVAKHDSQCKICNRTFTKKAQYLKHMAIMHSSEKPFSCDICQKSFKVKQWLRTHQKIHLSPNDTPVKCPYCSKSFRTSIRLHSHKSYAHRGLPLTITDPPFSCSVCKEDFALLDDLKKHVPIHKPRRIVKPATCAICKKTFCGTFNLKIHVGRFHKESDLPKNFRKNRFECSTCTKKFQCSASLEKHSISCAKISIKLRKSRK